MQYDYNPTPARPVVLLGCHNLESPTAGDLLYQLRGLVTLWVNGAGATIEIEAPSEEDNGGKYGVWLATGEDNELIGAGDSASEALEAAIAYARGGFR